MTVSVLNYALFIPGAEEPDLSFVPKMQRRRLSSNIKSSLYAAHQALGGGHARAVFASRYGEWGQTAKLLENYCNEGLISPMGFGLSVHNAAAGLFSLINGNKEPYSFISAGENTFSTGLLEAFTSLEMSETVLFVYSDEKAPDIYSDIAPDYTPCAAALLISKTGGGMQLNWKYEENPAEDDPPAFMRFLSESAGSFKCGNILLEKAG